MKGLKSRDLGNKFLVSLAYSLIVSFGLWNCKQAPSFKVDASSTQALTNDAG